MGFGVCGVQNGTMGDIHGDGRTALSRLACRLAALSSFERKLGIDNYMSQ